MKDAYLSVNDRYTSYAYGTSGTATAHTQKTVVEGQMSSGTLKEQVEFDYDVQGRLQSVTTVIYNSDGSVQSTSTSGFKYDDSGIRYEQTVDTATTKYLIDPANHTGYAQVLEEKDSSGNVKTFTLGLDVLTQHDVARNALTFLYDGHGSTRALSDAAQVLQQVFAYDAFGNHLTASPLTSAIDAWTSLLYSGEWSDPKTKMQYLRARYYDAATGRFNRTDPWAGDNGEPMSLHKYLYANANPVYFVDPSGNFGVGDVLGMLKVTGTVLTIAGISSRFLQMGQALHSMNSAAELSLVVAHMDSLPLEVKLQIQHSLFLIAAEATQQFLRAGLGLIEEWVYGKALQMSLSAVAGGLAQGLAGASAAVGRVTAAARAFIEQHHVLPMYLGGAIRGITRPLTRSVHTAYHRGLDRLPGLSRQRYAERGSGALRRYWTTQASPEEVQDMVNRLVRYTDSFDQTHGTYLLEPLFRQLQQQGLAHLIT